MEDKVFKITEDPMILRMIRDYHRSLIGPNDDDTQKKFKKWISRIAKRSPRKNGLVTFGFKPDQTEFIGIYYDLLISMINDLMEREANIAQALNWDEPTEPEDTAELAVGDMMYA